jgi:hypothetical protein
MDAVATEHQQVQVQLTGTPSPPLSPACLVLQSLEPFEQPECLSGRITTDPNLEGDHGVVEVRLVFDTHGSRDVQPRHAPHPDAGL